jgi:hypothetical protein
MCLTASGVTRWQADNVYNKFHSIIRCVGLSGRQSSKWAAVSTRRLFGSDSVPSLRFDSRCMIKNSLAFYERQSLRGPLDFHSSPAPLAAFGDMLVPLHRRDVTPAQIHKTQDHPLLAVCSFLFNVFTDVRQIWLSSTSQNGSLILLYRYILQNSVKEVSVSVCPFVPPFHQLHTSM